MPSIVFTRTLVETVEVQLEDPTVDPTTLTVEQALEYANRVSALPVDEEEPDYEFYVPTGEWTPEEVLDDHGDAILTFPAAKPTWACVS